MHWRRKWQPTPVFLSGESQGWGSLVGCRLWGRTVGHNWSDLAAAASLIAIDSLNLAQKVTSQDKNYILQPPLQLIVATWQNSRQLDVKESEAGNFLGETLKGRVMIFFPTPSILLIGAEMDCMHSWFRQIRETLDGAQPLHQALDTYLQPIE